MLENRNLPKKGLEIKCKRCKHGWLYKGNNPYCCTCPHCRTTIMIHKKITQLDNNRNISYAVEGGSYSL